MEGFPRDWGGARPCYTSPPAPSSDTPSAPQAPVPLRIFTRASQIDKSARCLRHRRLRPLRSPGRAADFACPACVPFLGPCRIPEAPRPSQRSPRPPLPPHVGRPRLQRRQGRLCWPRGARVRPRPGERRHFLLRLQAVREPAERVAVHGPAWKHALRYHGQRTGQSAAPRPGPGGAHRKPAQPPPAAVTGLRDARPQRQHPAVRGRPATWEGGGRLVGDGPAVSLSGGPILSPQVFLLLVGLDYTRSPPFFACGKLTPK